MGFNILGTRPTMDRVKESIFGMIQNNIKGSVCLDLFAGSGSLGIEALSNGARKCYFVEKNNEIYDILKDNISNISGCILIKSDYLVALNGFVSNVKFDLIFLDPPYKMNLISDILDFIYCNDILSDGGLVVCEYEDEVLNFPYFELIKSRKYGSKKVNVYRKF